MIIFTELFSCEAPSNDLWQLTHDCDSLCTANLVRLLRNVYLQTNAYATLVQFRYFEGVDDFMTSKEIINSIGLMGVKINVNKLMRKITCINLILVTKMYLLIKTK